MLELQTFGSVGLRARDVGDSVARVLQPKRLGLLVFLALTPRRRVRRRDHIVSLLWPDLDQEHARGALSQALGSLRRTLGDGVLVTQGDEEVGVAEGSLWCDAVVFRSALEEGDLEAALAMYKGPFLDGFFVSGAAPDYEEWVAATRARFRQEAARAAAALADRAAAAPATAVQWARRAAAISPDDEPVTARLIDLLGRAGDRLGALATYEALRVRLETEYGAEPSPATQAIVERIRGS